MIELAIDTQRGSFHLDVQCSFRAEWTVIFGHSGAGKSTLLRLIAGIDHAQHAQVTLDGRVVADTAKHLNLKPVQRRVAMVTQQPALFPHLNVAANVAFGIASLARDARNEQVNEMLHLVGAEDLLDHRPTQLSGGEAQRVALARALAPMPRLLLLDEPFSALDGAASDALLSRLQKWVSANDVQTVMATHDATDALAIGAEVALLREGRLIAQGPAAQVLNAECERLLARIGRG